MIGWVWCVLFHRSTETETTTQVHPGYVETRVVVRCLSCGRTL